MGGVRLANVKNLKEITDVSTLLLTKVRSPQSHELN